MPIYTNENQLFISQRKLRAQKLGRDVGLNNLHIFQLLKPNLRIFLLVVSAEVLNVLGMSQFLLSGIIPVIFLVMMNLILVLLE